MKKFPGFLLNFSEREMAGEAKHFYNFKSFRLNIAERQLLSNNSPISLVLIAVALIAFFTSGAAGQSGTTSVNGTVFDQQGKVVVGASVVLISTEKGFSRSVTTNNNGAFSFPAIQSDVYRLEVEMNGFKKFVRGELRALVDSPTEISAVLEIGNINETVNVTGTDESLLNTQDATVGNTFDSTQVTQLPTQARNVINLLTLQPGVTRFGFVAGGRSDQANITLDGVDVNEAQTNDIFNPVLRLNAEAIEEFRVTTTTANASQGRSSGAQISLVTKGGTNQLRGALFLSGRRTGWTANDFFNNRSGVERPKLDRNIFGGAVGGPVWKNRVFFFYSYEGERTTRGGTALRNVPLPNLGQGIIRFNTTTGQTAPLHCLQIAMVFPATNGCNPIALAALASSASRYPANSFEIGDGLNTAGFRFNADNRIKNNSHVFRLDFNINAKQQMFLRANYISDTEASAPAFPDTPAPSAWEHPVGFVIGHNWVISSSLVNNFRYGLTRDAFTNLGDSTDNAIAFGGVFSPRLYRRDLARITPVQNITDDVSRIWRNHTFQFGTNIRLIRNRQLDYASAYDFAFTQPGAYAIGSVAAQLNTYLFNAFGYQIAAENSQGVVQSVTAAIGRINGYGALFNFRQDGSLQPLGDPNPREFRTEEYDFYLQDIWKLRPNLTLTLGLRYGLSRPVYEAVGYEVKPTVSLSEILRLRGEGAANGTPYNEQIVLDLSGPSNGRSPLYKWDKNNFQPRIAAAWSPDFGENFFGRLFGRNNQSVIRGGFAVTNDYFGQQLAVKFDFDNLLGFASAQEIPLNTYNLTTNVAPLFTGFNQSIRNFPGITIPTANLTFPRQAPNRNFPTAIEGGFDENLVAPINYNWSLTYERTLPGKLIVSASYLGRKARNLLVPRDAAQIANFTDSVSGMDWNTAATQLEILRQQNTPVLQVPQIPYFANLFPGRISGQIGCDPAYNQTQAVYAMVYTGDGSCDPTDWTTVQLRLSQLSSRFPGQHIYYQPQYGTYSAWSTVGRSDYQGLTFTARQRLGARLTADFNYTYSHSKDDGSRLQTANVVGQATVINSFRQQDLYAPSDFDMRHIVNSNAIFKLPFGHGEPIFGGVSKYADLLVGGWQLTGIFRFNTGVPISAPKERGRWSTNWVITSYATRIADVKPCPTRGGSLYGCNTLEAYNSFRSPYPGESGERNVFRLPGFWVLDMGLGKTFNLPNEGHKFQVRWEVFNVANTQKMGNVAANVIDLDPQTATEVPTNFARFTTIQGSPRSMQFVLRYSF
ncbi:MAG: carboxypeptidase regulatory-like domain-containing protein [Pyrinomonadaceae bacterium]